MAGVPGLGDKRPGGGGESPTPLSSAATVSTCGQEEEVALTDDSPNVAVSRASFKNEMSCAAVGSRLLK